MFFARTTLVAAGIAVSLLGAVAAQEAPKADAPAASPAPKIAATSDTVAASVNGQEITVGHIVALAARLPEQYQTLADDVLFNGILEQLIQQSLLAQRVDDESNAMKYALENERRALLATEAISRIGDAAVTEDAVQRAYADRYTSGEAGKDFFASHILVKTEDEATAIVAELEGGADFAELAKTKSIGPSNVQGGELGWIEPGQTVAPFEAAALALQPGELSPPIETQFGWHVIKLKELRDHQPPKLEDVRQEIEGELSDQAIEAAVGILDEGATVERMDETIDPAVVRNPALLD
jgi:peptidyl-prolyl cis-trans isomerase C